MMLKGGSTILRIDAAGITMSKHVLSCVRNYMSMNPLYDQYPLPMSFPSFVRQCLPELAEFASGVKSLLQQEGQRAVVVESFPCLANDVSVRNFLLLSFTSCIGQPSPSSPIDRRVIWKVTPARRLSGTYTPTISERTGAASLHTDSSYREQPERYVALLAVRPAIDGGTTTIVDSQSLFERLLADRLGRICVELLRSLAYPFRVPTVFTKERNEAQPECIQYPIISHTPFVRFRHDAVETGFGCEPSLATRDALWAVDRFCRALKHVDPQRVRLRDKDLLILDNHRILHGRTSFRDRDRLLLRIRMSEYDSV
jgi:alpha-ketoglutarate-dependent taurine dioxygenase